MDNATINDMVDQQRWLLDNGLFTDTAKDNICYYGWMINKDITAVDVHIYAEEKRVVYELYMPASTLKRIDQYNRWTKSTSIMDMWRLKRLIKKSGDLNFANILGRFIKSYCGPKWRVDVLLGDSKNYIDKVDEESEQRADDDKAAHRKPD